MWTKYVFLGLIILYNNCFSQFQYGQSNIVEGSIICSTITTSKTTQENKIINRGITKSAFSSKMLIVLHEFDATIKSLRKRAEKGNRRGLFAHGMNYVRTLNETEDIFTAGKNIPKFPTILTEESKAWVVDPCQDGSENLVLCNQYHGSGEIDDPDRKLNFLIEGIRGDKKNYFLKLSVGTGWHYGGMPVEAKIYDTDNLDGDCKWSSYPGKTTLKSLLTTDIFSSGTDIDERYYHGEDGHYVSDGGAQEYYLLKIDTTEIFNYLREKPSYKVFEMNGSYKYVNGEADSWKEEREETINVKIILGELKNEIILSTANEDDYHNWLPTNKDETGYVPLKVRAELNSMDEEPKDTLHFHLNEVSNYQGICTNFPKPDNIENKTAIDFRFSENQSDPNIEYIDSVHVKTNTIVESAVVDIECLDYGGYAKLYVESSNKNLKGYSKYNNEACLIFPEDENKNRIADKWEKDVGIYENNAGAKLDDDKYPEEQNGKGDGYSLFEEYRGFLAEKDFLMEEKNIFRNGKHVRLDPNWKDIFVLDRTGGIFEKYYAPTNAAELNWHSVNLSQIKSVSSNHINTVVSLEGDAKPELVQLLDREEHRYINYNTPDEYKLQDHHGLFLFYLDGLNGSLTAGESHEDNSKPAQLARSMFIGFQKYEAFESAMHSCLPLMATCPNYPSCPYKTIIEWPFGDFCPNCNAALIKEKYFTYDEETRISKLVYESTTIHEIGHGLGLGHHRNGIAKYIDQFNTEHQLFGENWLNVPSDEKHSPEEILSGCGVTDCSMRYNMRGIDEFRSRQILNNKQVRYCRKGETYLDDYGNPQQSDNCFGAIKVK